MKIRFTALSSKEDPERAILPALLYTKIKEFGFIGHMISFGWWCWGVGLILVLQEE